MCRHFLFESISQLIYTIFKLCKYPKKSPSLRIRPKVGCKAEKTNNHRQAAFYRLISTSKYPKKDSLIWIYSLGSIDSI